MTSICESIATQEDIYNGSTSKLKIYRNCKNTSSTFVICKKTKVCTQEDRNHSSFQPRSMKSRKKDGSSQASLLNSNKNLEKVPRF
jgi:hypothetical protein